MGGARHYQGKAQPVLNLAAHAVQELIDKQMIPKSPLDYTFDENSTYVITGGLGGIGRSLASWMASLGARHLVLLSRSGVKSDNARDLVEKLEKDGVRVYAPPCDVSKADEVEEVVAHVNATMPPIKGCIHGALVVKVSSFLTRS